MDEIVVTAQRVKESLSKTPVVVSAGMRRGYGLRKLF
jgi:hypothetical protein